MNSDRRAMRTNRKQRVRAWIVQELGTTCAVCGATDRIEYAHLDRTEKVFSLAAAHKHPWARIHAEVPKCRALCRNCHIAETIARADWAPLPEDVRSRRRGGWGATPWRDC